MKDIEVWKEVPSLKGICEASNFGRIRTLGRYVYSRGRKPYWLEGKMKGIWLNRATGYLQVTLNEVNYTVHRLVAEAFIPNPNQYPEVNHKDENKKNNRVENLEWCTRRYNLLWGTARERMAKHMCIPIDVYSLDCKFIKSFDSCSEAAKELNCSISFICDCARKGGKIKEFIIVRHGEKPKMDRCDFRVQQIDIETGKIIATFKSPSDAMRTLGMNNNSGVVACCRGKIKQSHGFKWEYVNHNAESRHYKNRWRKDV